MTLSITTICHYSECLYAECHGLFIVMVNFIMLSVGVLYVISLSVAMLNAIMLSVVMLSVVAPFWKACGKITSFKERKDMIRKCCWNVGPILWRILQDLNHRAISQNLLIMIFVTFVITEFLETCSIHQNIIRIILNKKESLITFLILKNLRSYGRTCLRKFLNSHTRP